jgi:Tol biopolymer transport system component
MKQITFSPIQVDGFSWSPDETQFASRARDRTHTYRIYLVPSNGGAPVPLMAGDEEQGVPSWSADGSQLGFGDVPYPYGHAAGTERVHIFDPALMG